MLAPLVELVERMTLKHRGVALAIVYVVLVAALVALGVTLGSRIVDQASSLFSKLPDLVEHDRLQSIPLPNWLEPLRQRIVTALQAEAATLQQSIVPLLQRAGGHILSGISVIVPIILVPVFSFFLLKDARDIRVALLEGFEGRERSLLSRVLADIDLVLSKYIRALVILSLFSFGGWGIFVGGNFGNSGVYPADWPADFAYRRSDCLRDQRPQRPFVDRGFLGRSADVPGLRAEPNPDERRHRTASSAGAVRRTRG
jgi:predicted PurR-regulated permease PerM